MPDCRTNWATRPARALRLALPALLLAAQAPAPEPVTLHLSLTGLRSSKGMVHLCLWRSGDHFPDCKRLGDAARYHLAAAPTLSLDIEGLPPGSYAVSAIHDENGNGRLDKSFIGMPTEGIAFSCNPKIMFGPPKFAAAAFPLPAAPDQAIRFKYFL